MTSTSSTPSTWEDRYRRLATKHKTTPDVAAIDVGDLVVGDRLIWLGSPFTVERTERDGPIVAVRATRWDRTINVDYLLIESVDVACPRPAPAAAHRKAPT